MEEEGGGVSLSTDVTDCTDWIAWRGSLDFTTEHAETRFAGRGRQFEKFSFGFDTGDLPASYGFWARGRWVCEAKISNRLPCPAEPVSEFSVV